MVEGEGGGVGDVEGVAEAEVVVEGVGEAVDRCGGCCVGVAVAGSWCGCVAVCMYGCVEDVGVVWLGPGVADVDVLRVWIFNSLHREYMHIENFCVSVSLFCSFFA
jgi:hypothetical protein